ncbi:gluconate 2-dehydrogenase subunit 3 family protein [Altericroceibacterium xinjiangense]|uniref:gluconate 2-dehydrogenase subunit 3 family protein n=1 Tax=Altericroceibacterium xinjiangense TaxID=762261 RepID=UPI000F7F2CED|nr:gluconate 2-dehydrogenase subunit 3 family protein [Altericroceibacterium xinjiangense]
MADPYPTYDVLAKRDSASWDDTTRAVVDRRLSLKVPEGVLSDTQLATLRMVKARVCPDPEGRPPTTTLAMVVQRIEEDSTEGFRHHELPRTSDAWRRGLDAIEAEAQLRFGSPFADLDGGQADAVLRSIEDGDVRAPEWESLPPSTFWTWRVIPDLVSCHWSQPSLWSAMGFGGPASPRGYVRIAENRRDPWEALEERSTSPTGWPRHHVR